MIDGVSSSFIKNACHAGNPIKCYVEQINKQGLLGNSFYTLPLIGY